MGKTFYLEHETGMTFYLDKETHGMLPTVAQHLAQTTDLLVSVKTIVACYYAAWISQEIPESRFPVDAKTLEIITAIAQQFAAMPEAQSLSEAPDARNQ